MLAGAFLVVPATTPFLIVPITVRLAGAGAGAAALCVAMAVAGRFLTTVEVLPSLDSLVALTLRAVRVAGLEGWGGAAAVAPLLVRVVVVVAPPPLAELAVVDVVVLRAVAAARVERAFSTMLLSRLVPPILVGDTGRAMPDRPPGVGGGGWARSPPRWIRELDDVGDSTCPGLRTSSVAGPARVFFFGFSMLRSKSFSLSPPPDIS